MATLISAGPHRGLRRRRHAQLVTSRTGAVHIPAIEAETGRERTSFRGSSPAVVTTAAAPATDRQAEYRALMRKWWFGAAVGGPTMILSYPWLIPWLSDVFPRGSPQLWWLWVGMGVASLAVIVYSGSQFFSGAWEALRHRSANMHTLIAVGTGTAWIYSTVALLFPQIFPSAESLSRWQSLQNGWVTERIIPISRTPPACLQFTATSPR